MDTQSALKLLRAIEAGRICSYNDAHKVGISQATLGIWLRKLERMGCRIKRGKPCGFGRGIRSTTPYRITNWGPFKGTRK